MRASIAAFTALVVLLALAGSGESLQLNKKLHDKTQHALAAEHSSKVKGVITEETHAFCLQISIPTSVVGISIEGGLEGSVKGTTAAGKTSYEIQLTVGAGLQLDGIVLKLGLYYQGSFAVASYASDEADWIDAAQDAVKEFFVAMWSMRLGRMGKANHIDMYSKVVASYAKTAHERLRSENAAMANFIGKKEAGQQLVDQAVAKLYEYLDVLRGHLPKIIEHLKTLSKSNVYDAWQMVNFMIFRQVFYGHSMDIAKGSAFHTYTWANWQAPSCTGTAVTHDGAQKFNAVMCKFMTAGLLADQPSANWRLFRSLTFTQWQGKFQPRIMSGNRNTYNTIPQLFPEFFFKMDADNVDFLSTVTKEKIEGTDYDVHSNIPYDGDGIIALATKMAAVTPSKGELVLFDKMKIVNMKYTVLAQLLVLDPEKTFSKIGELRDVAGRCQNPPPTVITTTGTFGATVGSATIGFCTPDHNVFVAEVGWTTEWKRQSDCLYHVQSRVYAGGVTASLGPVASIKIWAEKETAQPGASTEVKGLVRLRLPISSSLTPASEAGTLQVFGPEFSEAVGGACDYAQSNFKIDTFANMDGMGSIVGEFVKRVFGAAAQALLKAEAKDSKVKTSVSGKVVKKIVGSGGRDLNSNCRTKACNADELDWIPMFFAKAGAMVLKTALQDILLGTNIFAVTTYVGIDLEFSKAGVKFSFNSEGIFGGGFGLPGGGGGIQLWKTNAKKMYLG